MPSGRELLTATFLLACCRYVSADLVTAFSSLDTQATRSGGGSYSYAPVAGPTIVVGVNGSLEYGGDLEFAWSSGIPSGATIDSATLRIHYAQNSSSDLSFGVFAHPFNTTYNTLFDVNFTSSASPIATFIHDTRAFGEIAIDATAAVAEQASLGQHGIGFALRTNMFTSSQFGFTSSGFGSVAMQPRLEISFTAIPEVSPHLAMGMFGGALIACRSVGRIRRGGRSTPVS